MSFYTAVLKTKKNPKIGRVRKVHLAFIKEGELLQSAANCQLFSR